MPLSEGMIGFGTRKYPELEDNTELIYGYLNSKMKVAIPPKFDCIWNFINGLAKVKLNKKWGFINQDDFQVIPIIYDATENLPGHEMLKVCLSNQWGFVDWQNQPIIEPAYDWISNFHNGLAIVKRSDKYGAIDLENQLRIPLKFEHLNPFFGSLTQGILNGGTVFVDLKGTIVDKK